MLAFAVLTLCVIPFLISHQALAEDELFGAEFAFTIDAQTGPFKTGTGFYMAGELGVPIL